MNNILETAGRLASNVCPELVASQPLYIIDSSSIEAGAFVRCDCYGLALPLMLAPQIRDLVGAKWTGPGPVVLLDLAAIELDARPGCTEQCTLSICLHEFAHLLPYRPVSILPDTDEIRRHCPKMTSPMTGGLFVNTCICSFVPAPLATRSTSAMVGPLSH
jgi:hypothetical protein